MASTISPTVVNFLAAEYNNADCTDPTGNTAVVSGADGECAQAQRNGAYTSGQCRSDDSLILHGFSTEDDTCSGEVVVQSILPAGTFQACSKASTASDFYYR